MRLSFVLKGLAGLCLLLGVQASLAQVTTPSPSPTPQSASSLEEELAKELGASAPSASPPAPASASNSGGGGTLRLIDLSMDALVAGGWTSIDPLDLRDFEGGDHDPKQNGFTVQNIELSFLGAIDPYLRGESHIVFLLDPDGESRVELEEAFLTTQTLPHGLQVKAGQFFTEFGRINPSHPHTWGFVDQPIATTRMFGEDGLRGTGVRASWLTPLPWYSELSATVQNAGGGIAHSFLGAPDEPDFDGFPKVDRQVDGLEELLYTVRDLNSFALSDSTTLNLGASGAFGPNATGPSARTTILGADAVLKWRAVSNYQGFPFVSWTTEFFHRDYGVGPTEDPASGDPGFTTTLKDWGLYSELLWGFRHQWVAGARVDLAGGDGDAADPLRDGRRRISADLTFFPSEFSKFRAQYNLDDAEHMDGVQHSVWLQMEFMIGAHGAHKF